MAMTPIYDYVAPWSWAASNGSASQTQVRNAYNAITTRGTTTNFSYLVWNDLVDKVLQYKNVAKQDWRTAYGTADIVKMKGSDNLTSNRFNAVIDNINYPYLSWWLDENIEGFVGREFFSGVSRVGNKADAVYGAYFVELLYRLNTIIEVCNGSKNRSELRSTHRSVEDIHGTCVALRSALLKSNSITSFTFPATFDVIETFTMNIAGSTSLQFNNNLVMVAGGLSAVDILIRMFTTQKITVDSVAAFNTALAALHNIEAEFSYQQPIGFTANNTIGTHEPSVIFTPLPSLLATASTEIEHSTTLAEIATVESIRISNLFRSFLPIEAHLNTKGAFNISEILSEATVETLATFSSEVYASFDVALPIAGFTLASISRGAATTLEWLNEIVSTTTASFNGGSSFNFVHDFAFSSSFKSYLNMGQSAVFEDFNCAFSLSLKTNLAIVKKSEVEPVGITHIIHSISGSADYTSKLRYFGSSTQLTLDTKLHDMSFFAVSVVFDATVVSQMEHSFNLSLLQPCDMPKTTTSHILDSILDGELVPAASFASHMQSTCTLECISTTWTNPVKRGNTLYIKQALEAAKKNNTLEVK